MVRSEELESNAIIDAMKRGDFYASSGVTLKAIDFKDGTLSIEIDEEEGVEYFTEFIGTRVEDGLAPVPGQHLMITNENPAVYEMTGNELYVRARITSSRFHPRPYAEGDKETAWVQPVRPRSTPES